MKKALVSCVVIDVLTWLCGTFISFTLSLHPPAAHWPHSTNTERLCGQEVDQRPKVNTVSFPLSKWAASGCCELAGWLALCSPDSAHCCSWGFGTYSKAEKWRAPLSAFISVFRFITGAAVSFTNLPPLRLTDVHSLVFLALLFSVQCGRERFIKPTQNSVWFSPCSFFKEKKKKKNDHSRIVFAMTTQHSDALNALPLSLIVEVPTPNK